MYNGNILLLEWNWKKSSQDVSELTAFRGVILSRRFLLVDTWVLAR
jgi:hypothetical protein